MRKNFSKIKKYYQVSHLPTKKMKRGFSLIEVLITLFVLALGIVAASLLMAGNIKNSLNSKNQIIASQLAQEGIELVRNMKDNAVLDSIVAGCNFKRQPLGFTPGICDDYRVDMNTVGFPEKNLDHTKAHLYLNGNYYTHNTAGASTKFFRRIDFIIEGDMDAGPPSTRVITATSYVTWNNIGFSILDVWPTPISVRCTIANKCLSTVSVLPDLE